MIAAGAWRCAAARLPPKTRRGGPRRKFSDTRRSVRVHAVALAVCVGAGKRTFGPDGCARRGGARRWRRRRAGIWGKKLTGLFFGKSPVT